MNLREKNMLTEIKRRAHFLFISHMLWTGVHIAIWTEVHDIRIGPKSIKFLKEKEIN